MFVPWMLNDKFNYDVIMKKRVFELFLQILLGKLCQYYFKFTALGHSYILGLDLLMCFIIYEDALKDASYLCSHAFFIIHHNFI